MLFSLSCAGNYSDENKTNKPNILFILADDLGIEGVSSYGGGLVDTPNIDRLAKEGMKFTHMFSNPSCTPTRAELLTGREPFMTNTLFPIWNYERHKDNVLDRSNPSFARQLQKVGYRTAIAGKWQLSFLAHQDWIHDFGFDTYMVWQTVTANNERTQRYHNPYFRSDGEIVHKKIKGRYGPDVMVEFLKDFIKASHDDKKPFLAYYTALLPHFPWVPTPASTDTSMAGAFSRGIIEYGVPQYYPDMIKRLDYNVGQLLEALDQLGIADNTIVIFMADNGTDQHLYSIYKGQTLYGGKGTLTDRGTRVPLLIRWPGHIEPNSINNSLIEAADIFPTLCELTGAPLPDKFIHGESFADILLGKKSSRPKKDWVHIQEHHDRYLRTKEWIVTDKGVYKKVQPYPIDAVRVDKDTLSQSTRERLHHLERVLRELKD